MFTRCIQHFYVKKDFIYVFLERRKGREKERERERETSICERNIDHSPLARAPTGDRAHNPGMRPDLESNC